jgi:hypothetical protein
MTGFFTQQLVVFQNCMQQDLAVTPLISKTNNYSAAGMPTGNINFDSYPPMVAAINVGIIQPVVDFTNTLSHNCPSGNCTFPEDKGASFSTIGIRHACKNVTSDVGLDVIDAERDLESLTLNFTVPDVPLKNVSIYPTQSMIMLATGTWPANYGDADDIGSLSTISMIIRTGADPGTNYEAITCTIFPTVDTYSVNISNSYMDQKLIGTVRMGWNRLATAQSASGSFLGSSEDWMIHYKLATSHVLRNGTVQACERSEDKKPSLIPVAEENIDKAPRISNRTTSTPNIWYYPQDCVWSFYKAPIDGISDYMAEIFNDQQLIWGQRLGGNQGSVYLRQIYQGGNVTMDTVDDMFKNITTSMTTVVRTHGAEGIANDAQARCFS